MSTAHYDEIDDPNRAQFSVFSFFDDESYTPVIRWVSLRRAGQEIDWILNGRACDERRKVIKRMIITDGGDHTVYEWTREKGVTWPPPSENDL
jgi:hypothetical protein